MRIKKSLIGFFGLCVAMSCVVSLSADNLVLLHTNDTHSMIQPDKDGLGGVMRRKALIDSVRNAERNLLVIDTGDAVQGTLFYKFFKGEVEYPLMDMMGYDIRILGNHEFDNGIEELSKYYKEGRCISLSSNYDFAGTSLDGVLSPYVVKEYGGKKIGIMALNIDPTSLIASNNIEGVKWRDVIESGNRVAQMLKCEGCDMVVAVTHIGYEKENDKTTDVELAMQSKDIDIIIGGHSHTLIDPQREDVSQYRVKNLDGENVLIAQCGKSGKYVGYINIDLDKIDERNYEYRLIRVDDRFDGVIDERISSFLAPYEQVVDSVNSVPIARASMDMSNEERCGAFANWTADFAMHYAKYMIDSISDACFKSDMPVKVDLGIMNVGGIRQSISKGDVTEGQVLSTFPFSNHMVLVRLSGADLMQIFEVMARKGGEAVSDEVRVVTDDAGNVIRVLIDNTLLDINRDYIVSTIDYLAWGNDDLTAFAKGEILWSDDEEVSVRILDYIRWLSSMGLPISGDSRSRFIVK